MANVKLSNVIRRAQTKVDKDNTDLIFYVGGEHIVSENIRVHSRGIIAESTIGPMFYYGFKAGDFLLVSRNPHLKKAGLVDFDGICSEKTFVLETADSDVLLPEFLPFVLQNERFWDYAYRHRHGSTNTFINWSTLANYEFELPDLETQRKLAEVLWSINDTMDAYKKLISATDELVKSQFMEQFFYSEKYQLVPISSVVDRKIKKKKDISKDFEEIRYIDISSINNQSKRVTGYVEFPIDETPSRAQQVLEKGDILISTVRPNLQNIAVNPYSEENVVASTGFCVLRCEKCLPEYIWGVITSEAFTNAMCEQASGISYPAVRDSDILQYLIPDAPIEIQEQFAAFVRQSDKSKYNALQAMRL